MPDIKKKVTTISEIARTQLQITRDEYALCSYIHYRTADPRQKVPGWCCDSKDDIAEFVGISRPGLYKMAQRLEAKGLLDVGAIGAMRATSLWIDTESECKQSLQNTKGKNVNLVDNERKQSLHKKNENVNLVDEVYNSMSINISKSKGDIAAEPLRTDFELVEEIEIPSEPEPRVSGKTASRRARKSQKENTIDPWTKTTAALFDRVASEEGAVDAFNWSINAGRDFKALKSIRDALQKDMQAKLNHEPTDAEMQVGFEYLFRYGYRYLAGIAKERGGAVQFSPLTIKNCYNQIIGYAKANNGRNPKEPTNKATRQHDELADYVAERRRASIIRLYADPVADVASGQ